MPNEKWEQMQKETLELWVQAQWENQQETLGCNCLPQSINRGQVQCLISKMVVSFRTVNVSRTKQECKIQKGLCYLVCKSPPHVGDCVICLSTRVEREPHPGRLVRQMGLLIIEGKKKRKQRKRIIVFVDLSSVLNPTFHLFLPFPPLQSLFRFFFLFFFIILSS